MQPPASKQRYTRPRTNRDVRLFARPVPARKDTVARSKVVSILLVILAFSAYLTETKFLSGLANNIGMFEVVTAVLLAFSFVFFYRKRLFISLHSAIYILMALIAVVAISTVKLPASNQVFGLVQMMILVFGLLLTVTLYNILLIDERYFDLFLRSIAYSAAIVALWVVIDQAITGGNYWAAGPFRNRAHSGIVMHTSFWLVLFYVFKVCKSNLEKQLFLWVVLPTIVYCIAVAMRQSIYVALGLGLVGLALGVVVAKSNKRFLLLLPVMVVMVFGTLIYKYVGDDWLAIEMFRRAADATQYEIEKYFIPSDQVVDRDESFSSLQRRGVIDAVSDHPLLGIGWGGFYHSPYSPTGHEVHSTPLRFLAETGLVGFSLYVFLMGRLVFGNFILWIRTRHTPNGLASLILFVGFCSLSVSHIYNRAITERTFWLIMIIALVYDTFIRRQLQIAKQQRQQQQAAHKRLAHRAPIRPAHS